MRSPAEAESLQTSGYPLRLAPHPHSQGRQRNCAGSHRKRVRLFNACGRRPRAVPCHQTMSLSELALIFALGYALLAIPGVIAAIAAHELDFRGRFRLALALGRLLTWWPTPWARVAGRYIRTNALTHQGDVDGMVVAARTVIAKPGTGARLAGNLNIAVNALICAGRYEEAMLGCKLSIHSPTGS